jgi:hypothetical protein
MNHRLLRLVVPRLAGLAPEVEAGGAVKIIALNYFNRERRMAEQCFNKKGSNPPTCGVHNVLLVHKPLPDEMIATGLKGFTFLACPVSGAVLPDNGERS